MADEQRYAHRHGLLIRSDGGLQEERGPQVLLHADLHNHTRLSDGAGWAEDAYASMRGAGLDVAAVTDHTYGACAPDTTVDDAGWRLLGKLADAADDPGRFVAVRGFEWSSPSLGHMNVWGSRGWVEPLPLLADGVAPWRAVPDPGPAERPRAITAFQDWLCGDPDAATPDGELPLIGFNHPGREAGRFGHFRFDRRLARTLVAFEMFNRDEDYLFEGIDRGATSPLVSCLDAGWRPGLIGVTDEHGPHWGFPEGLGRAGVWAPERTRAGLRAAMLRRRVFATRERGLAVDAVAGGVPMGGRLPPHGAGVRVEVTIDGPGVRDRPLRVQCLGPGRPLPTVLLEFGATVDGSPVRFDLPAAAVTGDWLVLRLTDPARPADPRADAVPGYRDAGATIAYLSPFHRPGQAQAT